MRFLLPKDQRNICTWLTSILGFRMACLTQNRISKFKDFGMWNSLFNEPLGMYYWLGYIEIGSSLINQRELSIQRKQESTLNMRSIPARILPHSCTFLREILPNTAAAVWQATTHESKLVCFMRANTRRQQLRVNQPCLLVVPIVFLSLFSNTSCCSI